MWWASVNSLTPGLSFASFAIRSSLVETSCEFCASVIFPSNKSVRRRAPLLGRVPRDQVPPRHSSYGALRPLDARPAQLHPCRIVPRCRGAARLHPRFLRNPCVHAPFFDPGGWCELDHRRSAVPVAHRRILSPLTPAEVSAPTTIFISGPHHAACNAHCLRFEITVTRNFCTISQDSLPAWWSPSSPVGFSPRAAIFGFGLLHGPPPQSGLSWRTAR